MVIVCSDFQQWSVFSNSPHWRNLETIDEVTVKSTKSADWSRQVQPKHYENRWFCKNCSPRALKLRLISIAKDTPLLLYVSRRNKGWFKSVPNARGLNALIENSLGFTSRLSVLFSKRMMSKCLDKKMWAGIKSLANARVCYCCTPSPGWEVNRSRS